MSRPARDSSTRVLYLGDTAIGGRGATGQTLNAMYGEIDGDRLLQLLAGPATGSEKGTIVELPRSATPVRSLLMFGVRAVRRLTASNVLPEAHDGLNAAVARTDLTGRQQVRHGLRALSEIAPVRLPKSLRRTIEEFRPDVVHSLLGSVRSMRLAIAISRRWQIPIAPHFMDDWPPTMYLSGELFGVARVAADRSFRKVLARSPLLLTIGRAMRDEYATRYRRPCMVVGNGVDPSEYAHAVRNNEEGRPRTIVYVGGLHLGRGEVLLQVARHLHGTGSEWKLLVHAPARDVSRFLGGENPPSLEIGAELTEPEVPHALTSADVLLFVESSDPQIAAFTRLSVSTKVPQYLAAAKPIVIVGPADQASALELASSARHACTLPSAPGRELSVLDGFLESALLDAAIDQELPDRFDRASVRREFSHALDRVAHARRVRRP
ncbi:MAG: glycosyltransferase [Agromyces sp.]